MHPRSTTKCLEIIRSNLQTQYEGFIGLYIHCYEKNVYIYRSIGLLYSCENKCVRMVVFLGGGGYPRIAITGRIP